MMGCDAPLSFPCNPVIPAKAGIHRGHLRERMNPLRVSLRFTRVPLLLRKKGRLDLPDGVAAVYGDGGSGYEVGGV